MTPDELIAQSPAWTQKAHAPFSIPAQFTWIDKTQHKRNVIPDGVVSYIDNRLEKPVKAMLFVEYDQDMDVNKKDPKQASIQQKIACYSAMFKDNTVKTRFGFDAFRVLFITTASPAHLETMIECCQSYRSTIVKGVPPYSFFFSTRKGFDAAKNPLDKFWRDGDGLHKNITRLGS